MSYTGYYYPQATGALNILTATSGVKTPTGSGRYHAMTGNSINLTPGTWELICSIYFGNAGAVGYTYVGMNIFAANGADAATIPSALSTVGTINTVQASSSGIQYGPVPSSNDLTLAATPTMILTVTTATTIYIVPYSEQTTSANARITAFMNARQIY